MRLCVSNSLFLLRPWFDLASDIAAAHASRQSTTGSADSERAASRAAALHVLDSELADAFAAQVAATSAARQTYAVAQGDASVAFAGQTGGGNANAPNQLAYGDHPAQSIPQLRTKSLASQSCTREDAKCAVPPPLARDAPVFSKPTIENHKILDLLSESANQAAAESRQIKPDASETTFSEYAWWAAGGIYNVTLGAVKEHFEWTHGAIAEGYSDGREKLLARKHKRFHTFKKAIDYVGVYAISYPGQGLSHGSALFADMVNLGVLPKTIGKQALKHLAQNAPNSGLNVLPHVLDESLCFSPDTKVKTPGGLVPISDITADDVVYAYDFDLGDWVESKVIARHDNNYDGLFLAVTVGQSRIESTAHHPFWVVEGSDLNERPRPKELSPTEDENKSLQGRWVNSHELQVDDSVMCVDGEVRKIEKIEHWRVDYKPVCNLTVEGTHTFAVGDDSILVHNTAWCDYLRRHAGDAPDALVQKLAALRAAGETRAGLHAHHIVKRTIGSNPRMAPFVREAQEILTKHGLDVNYSYDNLTWAISWDHSVEYTQAVAKALREADSELGKAGVLDALQRIAEILNRGEKFRGF